MRSVNRTEFLALLEAVSHGLSPRDIIEQSSCFVFDKGMIMTYNDQVSCRAEITLKLKGAVQAKPLMSILSMLPDDVVELSVNPGELLVIGKRRKASIRMENEVLLPIKNVEVPKKFRPLHENFVDAVSLAQECCGRDQQKFWTTCVHIHPKWVEACDNTQILRYRLKTNVKNAALVPGSAIKSITTLDMQEFCETDNWIHFRNKHGLVISCRRYVEEYKSEGITKLLKIEGQKLAMPKGLGEAAERAGIFSSENADDDQVLVQLSPGKLRLKGTGVSGWYAETKKIKYDGKTFEFYVAPKMLVELTKRHNECEVTEQHLKVNGGRFQFVACLNLAGEKDDAQEEQEVESNDESGEGNGEE